MKLYPKIYLNKAKLYKLMAKENLTALDLSTRLNCTQAQFSYWMNKKRAISPKKRKEIMQILNCSWSDVFEN